MNYHYYYPSPLREPIEYKYISQNPPNKYSIAEARYYHLLELAHKTEGKLKIALRTKTNYWTKWVSFYANEKKEGIPQNVLELAYDVHRSLLPNEIVIESDYEDYKDNAAASRLIGKMIESKGFIPHYYYSGSKSIHIHIFIDFEAFGMIISKHFTSKVHFFEQFIIWLRDMMITCWGLETKEFDKALIKSTHLIRAELSLNKKGHKTFLGYSYEDLTDEPFICNSKTGNYPSIATPATIMGENQFELKESVPNNLEAIVEEFLDYHDKLHRIDKNKRKSAALSFQNNQFKPKTLRKGVKIILSDDFAATNDGMKRALFILCNELKQIYSDSEAIEIAKDWNVRMDNPFREYDIQYRIKNGNKYFLKTDYIESFLKEIGMLE